MRVPADVAVYIVMFLDITRDEYVLDALRLRNHATTRTWRQHSRIETVGIDSKTTLVNGVVHSLNDEPAVVYRDLKIWFRADRIHRDEDLPAVIATRHDLNTICWIQLGTRAAQQIEEYLDQIRRFRDITMADSRILSWCRDGALHRDDDKPAVVVDGKPCGWYRHGLLHRDSGPATVVKNRREWIQNGLRHRDRDRPAVTDNYTSEWYVCGRLHRDSDLPARILVYTVGTTKGTRYDTRMEWYAHGSLQRVGDAPVVVAVTTFVHSSGNRGNNGTRMTRETRQWCVNGMLHRDGSPAHVEIVTCHQCNEKRDLQLGTCPDPKHAGRDDSDCDAAVQSWYCGGRSYRYEHRIESGSYTCRCGNAVHETLVS